MLTTTAPACHQPPKPAVHDADLAEWIATNLERAFPGRCFTESLDYHADRLTLADTGRRTQEAGHA